MNAERKTAAEWRAEDPSYGTIPSTPAADGKWDSIYAARRPLVAGRDCLCNPTEIAAGREIECLTCSRAVKPPAPQW